MNIPIKTTSFELGYGNVHSEDLSVTPQQIQADPNHAGYILDGIYQLSFTVQNILPSYPGYFDFEIDFGAQELISGDGWGIRTPMQVTAISGGPGYIVIDKELPGGGPVQGAQNFVIKFSVPGWQLKFSNLSLTFTPEVQ